MQVGVNVARRQVDHFAGVQVKSVQQKRDEDAGIAGVGLVAGSTFGHSSSGTGSTAARPKDRHYLVDGVGDVVATSG